MKIGIDSKILQKFPLLHIGVVVVRGVDNTGIPEDTMKMLQETCAEIKQDLSMEAMKRHAKMEVWQKAFASFGAKDKTCSVENLYRMIIEGKEIGHINKLVDIYNFVSIDNMVPIGGDDLNKVEGDIRLTVADGSESFRPLNSDAEEHPKPGEIIYRDKSDVLCRRWNWRECNKTKMTEQTQNVALFIEGLPPTDKDEIIDIMGELTHIIETNCGGEAIRYVLSASNTEIEVHL